MRIQHLLVTGLVVVAAGCGAKIAPVSGRITLDTKPLVNATVIFTPDSEEKNPGPGSQGKTNADGEFTLQLNTGTQMGAIVGKHKVSITSYEGDDGSIPSSGPDMVFRKALVPPIYNTETNLTFEVPGSGSTSANFDLKSNPVAAGK